MPVEPGAEHRETIASAAQAAAAGGITTLCALPDTDPALDDPALVQFVLRRGEDRPLWSAALDAFTPTKRTRLIAP